MRDHPSSEAQQPFPNGTYSKKHSKQVLRLVKELGYESSLAELIPVLTQHAEKLVEEHLRSSSLTTELAMMGN